MQDNRLRNRAGPAVSCVIAAASLLILGGMGADSLVYARGVVSPATPETGRPAFPEPAEPEETDWDAYLQYLLEMLCLIVHCETTGMGSEVMLYSPTADHAQAFIESYQTNGLKPYLTDDEITRGIHLAQQAKGHIQWGRGTPGTLSSTLAQQLNQTFTDIINDLQSLKPTSKPPSSPLSH